MGAYKNVADCVSGVEEAQNDDHDKRESSRECETFCEKKDGQWEQRIWDKFRNKPRYTFDKVNHIVDLMCAAIETRSYNIRVTCENPEATPKMAEIRNGIIRNIERYSKAQNIYNRAIRRAVKTGFDCWRVKTRWKKGEFVQEPYIEYIPNSLDRVWFDKDSVEQDASDAKGCWILTEMSEEKFKSDWPKANVATLGSDRQISEYWYKPNLITVGEYLWCEKEYYSICLLKNGMVVDESNPNYELMKEEYGVQRERKETKEKWYSRYFTAGEWLDDAMALSFETCPVVPVYGNYDYSDGKRIYRGVVERLMDPQRVLNYSKSRAVEEGALQPSKKYWMSRKMAGDAKNQQKLSKLNTSTDPVAFFEPDERLPGYIPQQSGANEINPHLTQLAADMANDIESIAGKYGVSLGKNEGLQSGVALGLQDAQASLGDIKWENALSVSIQRTADLLLEVIPKVMDVSAKVVTLSEDGKTTSLEEINTYSVEQRGMANDMSKGNYSCVVDITEGYNSRQKETVKGLLEVAAVKPEILDVGADIFMSNINSPGMDKMAERYRAMLIQNGQIPIEQMTDEEKQKMAQQMQQNAMQPDPAMIALQAEASARTMEGQAAIQNEVNDARKNEIELMKVAQKGREIDIKAAEAGVKIENTSADTVSKQIDNMIKSSNPYG